MSSLLGKNEEIHLGLKFNPPTTMAAKSPPNYNGETVDWHASGPDPERPYHDLASNNSTPRLAPPPRRTDHTYHDWAQYPPDDRAIRTTKKSNNNFVSSLFLNSPVCNIISPLPQPVVLFSLRNCIGYCQTRSILAPFLGSLMAVVSSSCIGSFCSVNSISAFLR